MSLIGELSHAKDSIKLPEVAWLSDKADVVKALSQQPSECLNPDAPQIATIGRIAFESPALLGGQAAKMELSCSSCHLFGRGNPDFFIQAISTKAGTADITHSFFSSKGGDNTVTAVTIPDLADRSQTAIDDRTSNEFRNKLAQLVETEFDGQPASKPVLDGLQAYLANIDLKYCQTDATTTVSLEQDWQRVMEAVDALSNYTDYETNVFLVRAARKRLEKIYLRFRASDDYKAEGQLIKLSRKLERLSLRNIKVEAQAKKVSLWLELAKDLYTRLKASEAKSLYNPEIIKQQLAKQ